MPFTAACNTSQKVKITVQPMDGQTPPQPAGLDGPLRITVVSGAGTFTQDAAEPLSFFVVSGATPGDTEYLVEGDADLDVGEERLIQDTGTLTVTAAEATSFGFTVGAPEPK